MTTGDLHPTQDFMLPQRWDCPQRACDGQVSGLSDLPKGARRMCRVLGTQSQVCLTPWLFLPLRVALAAVLAILPPCRPCPTPGSPQPPPSAASRQETWGLWFYRQLGRWARFLGRKRKERWTSPKPRVLLPVTSLSAKSSGTEGVGTARPWLSWAF